MPDEPGHLNTDSLVRKLATILSADVAEYSRLMGEDEEQTLRVFRGHKQVFESLVAMHRGRIFNTAGDAILAEFASAVEAVRCATDIQAALRTRNDQLPPSRQVRFRIGINLGDVMVQGQDLMGDGVNVAARIQTAAEPGGICISGSVHDQIRNKLSLTFQSLGERNYKNIQQAVRTFSITDGEGRGELPVAKPRANISGLAKWIAAGLLLVAGGYWAFTAREHGKAEHAVASAVTTQPQAAAVESTKPSVEEPAMDKPGPVSATKPTTPKADLAARAGAAPAAGVAAAKTADVPRRTAASSATPHVASPAAATSAASTGIYDGAYSGPICYAQTRIDPARCFRAKGTISGDKITGKWLMGKDMELTAILTGDVSPSGEVKIEMHTDKSDGSRLNTINLTGTIQGGAISANGSFLMGRGANLNWHKNLATSQH